MNEDRDAPDLDYFEMVPFPVKRAAVRSVSFLEQVPERPQHVHVVDDSEHFPRLGLDHREGCDLVVEQEGDQIANLRYPARRRSRPSS